MEDGWLLVTVSSVKNTSTNHSPFLGLYLKAVSMLNIHAALHFSGFYFEVQKCCIGVSMTGCKWSVRTLTDAQPRIGLITARVSYMKEGHQGACLMTFCLCGGQHRWQGDGVEQGWEEV